MLSKLQNSKGFLFTVEAGFVMLALFYLFLNFHYKQAPDLSNQILFMQVQDVVEVCSLKKDYSKQCIEKLSQLNPRIKVTCVSFNPKKEKCESSVINRSYIEVSAILT